MDFEDGMLVRHIDKGHVGIVDGASQIVERFENSKNLVEVRVRLLLDDSVKLCDPAKLVPLTQEQAQRALSAASRLSREKIIREAPRIIEEINSNKLADSMLIDAESWRAICFVRGSYWGQISDRTWKELCRRRGKLLYGSW